MTKVRYRHAAGGPYVPGYPADPEQVLELSDDEAARLVETGLYSVAGDEPPAQPPADAGAPSATVPADAGDTENGAEG